MSNPLESASVKGWLVALGDHEYFPYLVQGMRMFNRMDGWDQSSEWMEMKANGYRTGFEEAINSLNTLVDENFKLETQQPENQTEMEFDQDEALPDHVLDRFN